MAEVKFLDLELKKVFENLSDEDPLKKAIERAMEDIKRDVQVGRLITKDTHRKKNVKRFFKK